MNGITRIALVIGGAVVATGLAAWGISASMGPNIALGMEAKDLPKPDWIARDVQIAKRVDERASGIMFRHQILRLDQVERPGASITSNRGATLIYTPSTELEAKVNDAIDGKVHVGRGVEAVFAIGRLATATVVRLDATGHVTSVNEVHVAFVGFTLP